MKLTHTNLLLIVLVLLFVASCNSTLPQTSRSVDDWADIEVRRIQRIRIAVVLSTSGAGSEAEARDLFQAVELAAQDAGLVRGYQIELAEFNTQCSSAGGRSAALSIVNDPTLTAVIGPGCEEACESSAPIFESSHYSFMSPSCGSGASLDQSASGGAYLRTMYDGRIEAELAANFAYNEMGSRHVLLIDDGSSTVSSAIATFETRFLALGGHIEATRDLEQGLAIDQLFAELNSADIDLIYAPLMADAGARVIDAASIAGLADVPILGGRHFLSQWLLASTDPGDSPLYAVGPALNSPEYQSMIQDFAHAYGEAPSTFQAAYAYDAARLVIEAINSSASPQPNGNLIIGRAALRSALYSTAAHHGLTGTLTCSVSGDCSGARVGVSQVIDGKWTLVYVP